MKNYSPLISTILILLTAFNASVSGQIREITFGEIPKEDLEMTEYTPDPSADAVILENHASLTMDAVDKILVRTDIHIRIKIINTDGLDYANVEMPYGSDEKITGLKAASYNLEDGEVVQTEVDKKSIYRENTSRYSSTLRFSLPNVRPGTVIEYKYTLESPDYFSLYTFRFQEEVPVRRCYFRIEFPGYFEYKFVTGGDFKNIIYRSAQERVLFGRSSVEGFAGTWIGNNIPAYRDEPFSTGSDDYFTHIGFELSKINVPGYYFEDISPTYPKLSDKLLDRSDFGEYITKNSVVRKQAKAFKAQGGSETDILRLIYTYVSDYMMWNGYSDFTASSAMGKVYNDARGNSAEINLMLLSMLRTAGIQADPVILSTRENGLLNPLFAIMTRFNHVVVAATAEGKIWLLDATDPVRPFNMLPLECLNGQGWLINSFGGSWIDLTNGEHYSKDINLEMELDDSGNLKGRATTTYESYDAWQVRKFCSLQGEEAYRDFMQAEMSDWKITGLELENLKRLEEPVTEKIIFEVPYAYQAGDGIMYLNPVFSDRVNTNEFYAEERLSVIDLACPAVKRYHCTLTIPEGWTIAELPQSVNLKMDGGGAAFSYNIIGDGRKISLDWEINFSTTMYLPQKYSTIRNFWSAIISKQAEVIILRKAI